MSVVDKCCRKVPNNRLMQCLDKEKAMHECQTEFSSYRNVKDLRNQIVISDSLTHLPKI